MAYILESWDILISRTIHPDNLYHFHENEDWQNHFIQESESEREKLRTLLVKDFVEGASQKKMEFHVQFNQGILIRLLDKLHQYRYSSTVPDKAILLYESVAKDVSYILDFIEEYFTKYFDRSEKVPSSYLFQSKEDMLRHLERLKQLFALNRATDTFLIDMIVSNFTNFCNDEKETITYSELIYQKELLKELLALHKFSKYKDLNKELEEKLISLNFNTPLYFDYLSIQLRKQIDQGKKDADKISVLTAFQRKISLIHTRTFMALYPDSPSVKDIISDMADKELMYLRYVPENNSLPATMNRELVHVQFKGTEIYLFHKAFIDAGGATGETYKSILEKTAAYLSNKTRKGFSVESLLKNSDKVDYESKENLKRFLTKMIRNIDSY